MRANHANDPQPGAIGGHPTGRGGPGRLPRPRVLAAGGAVLAQMWGLGFGLTNACASPGEPTTELVSQTGAPVLLDQLAGTAAPVLEHPAAPVEQVLQERIRAGGLPLPGQATTVPDAFAIATVLVPAVPPQPRGDDTERASRSNSAHTDVRPATAGIPAQRVGDTAVADRRAAAAYEFHLRPAQPIEPGAAAERPAEDGLALTAASPARTDDAGTDTAIAVLVPIAAGLLLTGAAMYKHRGLPRGH